jgi:hypothetical protein
MAVDSLVEAWFRRPVVQARVQLAAQAPKQREPAPVRALRSTHRYQIRENAGVRTLVCVEAPTIAVRMERGRCVRASEARHAPPGTIFLDGAAACEPFADPVRGVYNLDHHEGCVRPFTLSTCEQAMALLLRGLDLRKREWNVLANDADLDVVLAIWVLLNHLRRGQTGDARASAAAALRGTSTLGFAANLRVAARSTERGGRSTACWNGNVPQGRRLRRDPLAFVAAQLRAIDRIACAGEALEFRSRSKLARAGKRPGSPWCALKGGIYEPSAAAALHGERLALVLPGRGPLQPARGQPGRRPARRIYAWLNHADPASGGPFREPLGGAGEIGGSRASAGRGRPPRSRPAVALPAQPGLGRTSAASDRREPHLRRPITSPSRCCERRPRRSVRWLCSWPRPSPVSPEGEEAPAGTGCARLAAWRAGRCCRSRSPRLPAAVSGCRKA